MSFLHRRCRREIRSLVAELDLLHRMYDRQVEAYTRLYNEAVAQADSVVVPFQSRASANRGHPSWNVQ